MSTVIMMFILPLGILVYFFDKKVQKQNLELFDSYVEKIKHSELYPEEKLNRIDNMYYENGYKRVYRDANSLIMSKKHFNLGVLFIFFGALTYFGLLFYFIYYQFFLKPDEVIIKL